MLRLIKDNLYNRNVLIGLPNLSLKNVKCQNITCGKTDKFKKYKDNSFMCECGYIISGNLEIEKAHKVKLYCGTKSCIHGKVKMDRSCISCELIRER